MIIMKKKVTMKKKKIIEKPEKGKLIKIRPNIWYLPNFFSKSKKYESKLIELFELHI